MIPATEKSLGEALVSAKLMTQDELSSAIEHVEKRKSPSLIIQLMESGFLKFGIFQKFLAQNYKMRTAILAEKQIPQDLVEKISLDLIKEKMVMPIMAKTVNGTEQLALGMVNPLDEKIRAEIQKKTSHQVTPVLISLSDFKECYEKLANFSERMERTPIATYEEQVQSKHEPMGEETRFEMIQLSSNDSASGIDFIGNNIRKYKEEVALKLFFDEKDYAKLKQESYSREDLMHALAKVSHATLERNFESLDLKSKFEALVNTLIAKGIISKKDLLVSAGVSRAFQAEEGN